VDGSRRGRAVPHLRVGGLFVFLALVSLSGLAFAQTPTIRYSYDALGRLIGVLDESRGELAEYRYDAVGNLLQILRRGAGEVSILTFTPTRGPLGTTVTITGTGFSPTASQTTLAFNGVAGSVTSATSTQIVATVPAGATTGPITVTNPNGSAASAQPFTVQGAPTITGFTPTRGGVGTSVRVEGSEFDPMTGGNVASFNGVRAVVTAATAGEIRTTVPSGATTGPIAVTTSGGMATSATLFTILEPPRITGVSPTRGPAGTSVTISGTGFGGTVGENAVRFDSVLAAVATASPTELVVTVPTGAATGPITVTASGGTATSPTVFLVPVPSITSLAPTSGRFGATVTISGEDFSPVPSLNDVRFNGFPATVTFASATQLTAAVPVGATTGPITVATSGGTARSAATFTVFPPPGILGFTPGSGAPGTPVTITGIGFRTVLQENQVAFNGVAAAVRTATATRLDVAVPTGATTGPITVTTSGGTATSATAFTVVTAGEPTGVNPSVLSRAVPTVVTFTATRDLTAAQVSTLHPDVTISGISATGSTLTAVVTAGLRAPLQAFSVDVVLPDAVLRGSLRLVGVEASPAAGTLDQAPLAMRLLSVGVDLAGSSVSTDTPQATVTNVQTAPSEITLTLGLDGTLPTGDVQLFINTPAGVRHAALFRAVNVPRVSRLAVASVFPPPGTPSAPPDGPIRIRFTDPLDPASLSTATVRVSLGTAPIGGSVALSADRRTVTYAPNQPLPGNAPITVTLTQALRSQSGETLSQEERYRFTTARNTLVVDAALGNDTTGTGTPQAPFATIGRALTQTELGTLVQINAGTYPEALTVPAGVTLLGAGPDLTIVDGSGVIGSVIELESQVAILRLGVQNGQVGIRATGLPLVVGEAAATGQADAGVLLEPAFETDVAGELVVMDSTLAPALNAKGLEVLDAGGRLEGTVTVAGNTIATQGPGASGVWIATTVGGAIRVVGNALSATNVTQGAPFSRGDEAIEICCELRGPVTILANALTQAGYSEICCTIGGPVTVAHNVATDPGSVVFFVCCPTGPSVGEIRLLDNTATDGWDDGLWLCCGVGESPAVVARNRLERMAGTGLQAGGGPLTVASNTLMASGEMDLFSQASGDITVVGNIVTGSHSEGLLSFAEDKAAGDTLRIVSNRLETSAQTGLDVRLGPGARVEVTDNQVTESQDTGLSIFIRPPTGAVIVARNTIERHQGPGMVVELENAMGDTALFRDNRVADNGGTGVEIFVPPTTRASPVFRSNTIIGNARHGVQIRPSFGTVQQAPDLGTATDPGGNTLTGNGASAPATYVDLANETAPFVTAVGNRWDHGSATEIDQLDVFDDEEGAAQGRTLGPVQFEPFLTP
jgi:YD repeat-containing protein